LPRTGRPPQADLLGSTEVETVTAPAAAAMVPATHHFCLRLAQGFAESVESACATSVLVHKMVSRTNQRNLDHPARHRIRAGNRIRPGAQPAAYGTRPVT